MKDTEPQTDQPCRHMVVDISRRCTRCKRENIDTSTGQYRQQGAWFYRKPAEPDSR